MWLWVRVPPGTQLMKESKTTEFIYYTGNFNLTSFGGDPDIEETFHVYKATRNPDGSVVIRAALAIWIVRNRK